MASPFSNETLKALEKITGKPATQQNAKFLLNQAAHTNSGAYAEALQIASGGRKSRHKMTDAEAAALLANYEIIEDFLD